MRTFLYHRVNPEIVKKVLQDQVILPHNLLDCVCMTRDKRYLQKHRSFVVIFDKEILQRKYRVRPYCFYGNNVLEGTDAPHHKLKLRTEAEERVYGGQIPLELAAYVGPMIY